MESEARALNYYTHGSAAPTIQAMVEAETRRIYTPEKEATTVKERLRKLEKERSKARAKAAKISKAEKTSPSISVFAILGTLFVAVLMVFVVLAQINFNETAAEAVRLNMHRAELEERYRVLELAFESAVDIKEVERFARDELGMSRPDSEVIIIISSTPRDSAMVINSGESKGIQGFASFIKSLTEYFR